MGYNLRIGEFEVEIDHEERRAWERVTWIHNPESPMNSSDNHSNSIDPGYAQWADFTRSVGLYDVFYGANDTRNWVHQGEFQEAILGNHPGLVALTPAMMERFKQAQAEFRMQPVQETEDYIYTGRRVDWLTWWSEWALSTCKYPSFGNR